MLEDAAAQQAIGSDAGAAGAGGVGVAAKQAGAYPIDEFLVVEQVIDGVESVVLEEGDLLSQWSEEEEGLSLGGGNHRNRLYRLRR